MRGQAKPRPETIEKWNAMLQKLLQGCTVQELAAVREVSYHTIQTEMYRMRQHYGASTTMHAVLLALQAGDLKLSTLCALNP
jgi:DNA-binding CsgD family transcriptional regulator